MKIFLKAVGSFLIDLALFPTRLLWHFILYCRLDDIEAKRSIMKLDREDEELEKRLLRKMFK